MKKIVLLFSAILVSAITSPAQLCDELGSYNATWTIQARAKEEDREEREIYYKTLTKEQLERVGDLNIYPTNLMTCGMGFSNGLGKIFIDGKAGFINTEGKIVIQPQFKYAGRFSENLAPVEFENGKWGYINKKGETVIKPEFDWALIFREGRALIQVKEKWGFIDLTGKIIIKPQFTHANSFSEDLAMVQVWGNDELYEKDFKVLKTGYIDKFGTWIIEPTWDGGDDFQNGRTTVDKHLTDETSRNNYYGCFLIDKTGKKLSGELEKCPRSTRPNLKDSNGISTFFEDYKTGYKNKAGRIIWKPTK
jgi:WG containing repeat